MVRWMFGIMAAASVIAVLSVQQPGAAAEALPADQGRAVYKDRCESCHGRRGEMKALGRSKRLADIDEAAVFAKLQGFRQADAVPRAMQDRIKSALSEDEARAVAAYVASFGRASSGP